MKILKITVSGLFMLSAYALACAADSTVEVEGVTLTTSKAAEGFSQKIRGLNQNEMKELKQMESTALRLVQRYVPEIKKNGVTAKVLDQAYTSWLKDKSRSKPAPDELIPAFGVQLGNLALKECKGNWVHVTDNYGEGLAIDFLKSNQQVYPIDSVYKRFDRQEDDFFVSLFKVYVLAGNDKLK